MATEESREFDVGGMWDVPRWELRTNVRLKVHRNWVKLCKHCIEVQEVGQIIDWVCPAVVVGYTEGGHESAGVCLECIRENTANV